MINKLVGLNSHALLSCGAIFDISGPIADKIIGIEVKASRAVEEIGCGSDATVKLGRVVRVDEKAVAFNKAIWYKGNRRTE